MDINGAPPEEKKKERKKKFPARYFIEESVM
jgi:hypothetical protein